MTMTTASTSQLAQNQNNGSVEKVVGTLIHSGKAGNSALLKSKRERDFQQNQNNS